MARQLFRHFEPSAVVGFGGYPALPALLGAFAEKVPTIIHEQNAVLGRVNRFVAAKVDAIATAYPDVRRIAPAMRTRSIWSAIRCAKKCSRCAMKPIPPFTEDGVFRVLVTGGSQGATCCPTSCLMGWRGCR